MTTLAASRNGLRLQALKPATTTLIETFALSFVIAAVAGVLPLVMYLRG